ncbi:MAG: hypothetical protein KIT72_10450 [Polyangiaceae bacterium]|nr:hypothetical protein [Polyangiaceae bacterium]MCW5790832.1 hypothetical protein [Polyangiaceae bacterium]
MSAVWLTASLGLACAQRAAPPDAPDTARSSDEVDPAWVPHGVVKLPPPRLDADTQEGVVTLIAPPSLEQARSTVRRFFRAVVNESEQGILEEMAPSRSHETFSRWRRRFATLDYDALQGVTLFQDSDLTITRGGELSAQGSALGLSPDFVVIVVKPRVTKVGTSRLFGDELVFYLQSDTERYRITNIQEDFPNP